MSVYLIKSESDYNKALEVLEVIFDAKKGTEQGDELELLGMLIVQYEKEHFPIDLPNPIVAIKFRMEQKGYN
jgi:HTH-type transcriptional regulator / antitoxin HigA